ncbi:hypothetical protein GW17_00058431 [Ensete ventricosum]|nr:hypothetical protein GW17_00058431 [Ensete ventricosum]RZR84430.1 hypothetical protein BHM03_00011265 [Ensete ventricosum]
MEISLHARNPFHRVSAFAFEGSPSLCVNAMSPSLVRLRGLQAEMVGASEEAWQPEAKEVEGRVVTRRLPQRAGET